MAASDLAILSDVKTWLAGSSGLGSSDDALLARLITDVSGAIYAYLCRSTLLPRVVNERYDGNGKERLYLRNYPVTAISSLVIGQTAITAAPTPGVGVSWQAGYLLDPWDGTPPGWPQALDLRGHHFHPGRQNVLVSYAAGYQVVGEPATVPANPGPYTCTPAAPYGPWGSDQGVTYANGTALTPVTSAPTQGQYQVVITNTPDTSPPAYSIAYTFAAADAGAAVLISYGFIPASINNACIEWVAERYRYRSRVGQSSQTVTGQMTSAYSLKGVPDFIKASLDPYKAVATA
jgi:hypothetical protein